MGRYRGDVALALAPLAPRAPPPLGTLLVRVRARDRARARAGLGLGLGLGLRLGIGLGHLAQVVGLHEVLVAVDAHLRRYGEIWGDMGRCGEMWGDVGRYG